MKYKTFIQPTVHQLLHTPPFENLTECTLSFYVDAHKYTKASIKKGSIPYLLLRNSLITQDYAPLCNQSPLVSLARWHRREYTSDLTATATAAAGNRCGAVLSIRRFFAEQHDVLGRRGGRDINVTNVAGRFVDSPGHFGESSFRARRCTDMN